ncbi:MAG: LysE family transporter, partial [Candidatus Geothermincolia bacterium]
FGVVALAGGSFLLWMGTDMVLAVRAGRIRLDLQRRGRVRMGPFAAGMTTSLANPYWSLWWATFGLTWLGRALEHGAPGAVFFFAGHISADILWYSLVAFLVVSGRRFFSERLYRRVIIASGGFLVILGARFIADGLARV